VAAVWGQLLATDAAVLDQKLTAIAATVCDDDPRSAAERRSDAAGAWANGSDYLLCACGSPKCPVANRPVPKSSVLVTVIADQTAIDGAGATKPTDAQMSVVEPHRYEDATAKRRHSPGTPLSS
jgi:Domain of unknown function (DUF222)